MTDQLYCPACGPDWHGAYDMHHRCVECGVALKAEKVMERLKAVEEERDALAAQVRKAQMIADRWQGNDDNIGQTLTAMEIWALRADSDPSGALRSLKAEWQAEALDDAAAGFDQHKGPAHYLAAQALRLSAAELRRQSEGEP